MNLLETHAREKAGMPETWQAYRWECFPKGNEKTIYYELTCAIAPLKKRGKYAGYPHWKAKDKSTVRVVVVTVDEHKQWIEQWEAKTGKCSNCVGTGKTLWKVSAAGSEYKTCSKCNGSGTSQLFHRDSVAEQKPEQAISCEGREENGK